MTYSEGFCHLNSPCISKSITLMLKSFSRRNELLVKNEDISLLWELNSIFMEILRENILLY